MLITELSQAGLRLVDRQSSSVLSLMGDSLTSEPETYYGFFEALRAGAFPELTRDTHMISASLGVLGERALFGVWALDLESAGVVAMAQIELKWPPNSFDWIMTVANELVEDLRSGGMERDSG